MDYKKKYEEVLERAKEIVNNKHASSVWKEWLCHCLPELKESEDEKIRKAILELVRQSSEVLDKQNQNNMIAWLEKQGNVNTLIQEASEKSYIEGVRIERKRWLEKQGDSPIKWNKNTKGNKPQKKHSVLIKTTHGIAEGEWYGGEHWIRYRWSGSIKDSDVLFWIELSDIEKKDEQNSKIIKGKNYFCVKTHNYAGVEWIKGTKYYASDNYTLVNQGCEYYCPKYSKEEHNNLFKEVKCDGCVEKQNEQKPFDKYEGLTNFERTLADICIGWIGEEIGWKQYIKDSADILLKIAIEKFNSIQDAPFEQNHANKVEPKFHEGDWVVDSRGVTHKIERVIENVTHNTFGYDIVGGGYFNDDSDVHIWTIQDAKDGDVLLCEGKHGQEMGIVKNFIGKYGGCDKCFKTYCYIDLYGIFRVGEYMGSRNIHPAAKEQRAFLFQKMKEAGYEWDSDKKELKKIK